MGRFTDSIHMVRTENDALCFEVCEDIAVMKGDWKAVQLNSSEGDGNTWKLYNLKNDISEKSDLSDKYPDVIKDMVSIWQQYADYVGYIKSDKTTKH